MISFFSVTVWLKNLDENIVGLSSVCNSLSEQKSDIGINPDLSGASSLKKVKSRQSSLHLLRLSYFACRVTCLVNE